MHSYMFDNAAISEYERLDLMSKILDPGTRASLKGLGLRPGWNCLELGGGNGSITEWLCKRVGDSGSVTSVDIDPKLIERLQAPNLLVRKVDVRTENLPAGLFDLVMCRAMLHQISDYAERVLTKMAAAVHPGGWLFVCEPDFSLVQTTEPSVWAKAWDGIIKWGQAQGVDWFIGRKLPTMVSALGFGYPEATSAVPSIRGTTRDAIYFAMFFQAVRERVISSNLVDADTFEAAARILDDPGLWTQCWMLTTACVRKPVSFDPLRSSR